MDIKENRFAAWLTPEQQEALFEVTNISFIKGRYRVERLKEVSQIV